MGVPDMPIPRSIPMGLLPDREIRYLSNLGMIEPFQDSLIRKVEERPVVSYGLSSYGYDLRLSPKDFRIFRHVPGQVVDPKNFKPEFLEFSDLHSDSMGDYFILPGNSYALGASLEKVTMPSDVTAICMGKSTNARCGVIANITPIEAGWSGYITLEFSNSGHSDVRLYADEGIVQLLFIRGESCEVSYADRKGKYQNQQPGVTTARI